MLHRKLFLVTLLLLLGLIASACNLGSAPPEQQLALTVVASNTAPPTRTPPSISGLPTTLPLTAVFPTSQPFQQGNFGNGNLPPIVPFLPPPTSLPVSIVILSPIPGNIVAGTVQVLGAAIHPEFLQYVLEYGPDPNPGNLWYPITGPMQASILNGLLGFWNTTGTQDGSYQLRLRVYLRDGTSLATVVNSIHIQNGAPTPVPSNTPTIPRPIAAFSQSQVSGQVPLTISFFNQSSGSITTRAWHFGDGSISNQNNPVHTYSTPGLYTVDLSVTGPGGNSNVSRQINARAPNAPVAAFTSDVSSGTVPLTVKFTNQSTGSITAYSWNFSDSQSSTDPNPVHTFSTVGIYNVILTVTGPGGASTGTRQIVVQNPQAPPPVSLFTASTTGGNAPLAVQFTNQSTGNITSLVWSFGDGFTSTAPNPSHIFNVPGTYTVVLTVGGPGGTSASQVNIAVNPPPGQPVAVFSANPTSGTAPLAVQFTNHSTGTVSTYAWDFGDGNTSTQQSPSHTYNNPGSYVVSLTVTGPGGTSTPATTSLTVSAPAQPPVASFSANPNTGIAPLAVQFTNQSTGDITTYAWNFGDESSSTDPNPAHTFVNPGAYTVQLTASGPGGSNSYQDNITVTAPPQAPVAQFTTNPISGTAPLSVQFTDQSTGSITNYAWNFGDGVGASNQPSPSYVYNTPGNYTVILTVTGPGGSNAAQTAIAVSAPAQAPVAQFSANPTSGTAPLSVQFTNQSTGSITTYAWDFGDGVGSSNQQSPSYVYNNLGNYTVTLTVTGPGGSNAAQTAIAVSAPAQAPVAQFSANPTSGTAPLTVQFTNQSSGSITTYAWDFGDGVGTSNQPSPSYVYNNPGNYPVTLTVTGPGGSTSAQTIISVSAPAQAPVAQFSANPTSGVAPLGVQFTDQSTGSITTYAWDFGDGVGASNQPSPSYVYNNPGNYTVTLTVTGPGGSTSAQTIISVSAPAQAPVASFSANPTSGVAPLGVQFTDQSTGSITTYAWDFGDGVGSSNQPSPSYVYNNPGNYTVTLTVTGPGGSTSAQTIISVSAPAQAPVASFSANPTSGAAPLSVQFTDQSSGSITTYAWDFGDGVGASNQPNPSYVYNNPGNYTVTLTVTGPGGVNAAQTLISVSAPAQAPVAQFSANPTSGVAPLGVQFTDQSTGSITTYAWDFGDGVGSSNQPSPSYVYNNPGNYPVTLTVTGPGGVNAAQTTISVSAPAQAPVASFSANPTSGAAPLSVQFTDQSSGSITTYAWDFGDGVGSSNQPSPSYVYNNPGNYTVTLTVTGPGGVNAAQILISVSAPAQAPVASFSANPTSGVAPLGVQFTDQSAGSITTYAWDFGDGVGTNNQPSPSYVYNNPGNYTVTLTVTGPGGVNAAQTLISVSAPAQAPVASFSANPTSGAAPLSVQFTDQSTGSITTYAWDFGDGVGSSNQPSPSYVYNNPGNYTVTLTVTGPGGVNAAQTLISVSAPAQAPVASFSANPTSGAAPLSVQFTDQSTGSITNYAWDFGDGVGSSNQPSPSYVYNNPGNYTVTLTVTGPGGVNSSQSSISVSAVVIQPSGPQILFVSDRDGNAEIYTMGTDGSNPINLTNNPANDGAPAWSPDGSKIAFATNRDGNAEIYVMNADGSNSVNLTNAPGSQENFPAWSPDGSKIAFVSDRDGNNEIYVMNADGSNPVNLTNNPSNDNSPAWSHDGSQLAFVTDRDGNSEIYVMNADGSNPTDLTNEPHDQNNPAWSPKSSNIAYTSNQDGNQEVYVLDAQNPATQTNLTNNPGSNDSSPTWSSNGNRMAFVSERDGNAEIYIMNANGANQTNLTNNPANDGQPAWQP